MKINILEEISIHASSKYWDIKAHSMRKKAMNRPFSGQSRNRILLVSLSSRIPQSQIFPFHFFRKDLENLYNADVCEINLDDVLCGKDTIATNATIVAVQTPFDISDLEVQGLFDRLHTRHPNATYAFLDWYAPTDLRNAEKLNGNIDLYIKKSVLRDRSNYEKPTFGDTNLTDYYNVHFGIPAQLKNFPIPERFFEKLIVGPSFCTAPSILPSFLKNPRLNNVRQYDLHARFDENGSDWYRAMRGEARNAVNQITDISVVSGFGVGLSTFLRELRSSKACFSPFGYGEVCWRDFEAIMSGAVLIKPDMSHVETSPDIFQPWETYVPVRWDLSDLRDSIEKILTDDLLRKRIADQAFSVVNQFLTSRSFAESIQRMMM